MIKYETEIRGEYFRHQVFIRNSPKGTVLEMTDSHGNIIRRGITTGETVSIVQNRGGKEDLKIIAYVFKEEEK